MEPILIILIILIISAIRNALDKGKGGKTRRRRPTSSERSPERRDSGQTQEEGEFTGWPGSDQFPPFPGKENVPWEGERTQPTPFEGQRKTRETATGESQERTGTDVFIDDQVKKYQEREKREEKQATKPKKRSSALYTSKKRYSVAQRGKSASTISPGELLADRNDLKKGILLKEVLGNPKSREMLQKYSRFG